MRILVWLVIIERRLVGGPGTTTTNEGIDGLMQNFDISSALEMEILQSCTKSSEWSSCIIRMGHVARQPFLPYSLGIWYSSLCNSFEDQAITDWIYGSSIFKGVSFTSLIQNEGRISTSYGHQGDMHHHGPLARYVTERFPPPPTSK